MSPIALPPSPVVQRRLRDAVLSGNAHALDSALDAGAVVNTLSPDGRTLLSVAAARCDLPMVRRLLALGADATAKGDDGKTPLHHALERAAAHQDEVVVALIEAGADVNAVSEGKDTPMHRFLAAHTAQAAGHEDSLTGVLHRMFHAMMQHGADLRHRDGQGRLAPHVWADRPQRLARHLLEAWVKQGGDPHAQDLHGRDVVDRARLHADEPDQWQVLARLLHAAGMERRGEQKRWVPEAPRNSRALMGSGIGGSPLLRSRR